MPPTLAAASNIYSILLLEKKLETLSELVKSSSDLSIVIMLENPLDLSFLSIADPTNPLCPAI